MSSFSTGTDTALAPASSSDREAVTGTASLSPKLGRARPLAEKSGSLDPGAVPVLTHRARHRAIPPVRGAVCVFSDLRIAYQLVTILRPVSGHELRSVGSPGQPRSTTQGSNTKVYENSKEGNYSWMQTSPLSASELWGR